MTDAISLRTKRLVDVLPQQRDLYYDGQWQVPRGGYLETINPGNGASLGRYANANAADVTAAVEGAQRAFESWRRMKPLQRAARLRQAAQTLREHAEELALIDAANCGNPVKEMTGDVEAAAAQIDYFAGLVTEIKGETIPIEEGIVNLSVREPYGVCARIVAYNHPLMFVASKLAAPLAAGNCVIMKPPHQAPLSSYRMIELIAHLFPPGVLNLITGGAEAGQALVDHPMVPHVSLIGSVPTGRAIAEAAARRLKQVSLELGGKNACIIYPDADLERAAKAAVDGMNFTWCGQSCGSTSRVFIHESVYDKVVDSMLQHVRRFRPGDPTEPGTTMGALISRGHYEKVLHYIEVAKSEGATLLYGGRRPDDPRLKDGFFVEPTLFADVTQDMRIANEEVFGPVLSILKWRDEARMFDDVNAVEYGLTCGIWTTALATAHRAAARVQAGYVWVNNAGRHFIGAPFGGYKQSGLGREESVEELLNYTQLKNINLTIG